MVDGRDAQAPPSSHAQSDPFEEREDEHTTDAKSTVETSAEDFTGKWQKKKRKTKKRKEVKRERCSRSKTPSTTFTPPPAIRFDSAGFTLESVLARYARFRNMRADIYVCWFLLFATSLYSAFWQTRDNMRFMDEIVLVGTSPLCCCEQSTRTKNMLPALSQTYMDREETEFLCVLAIPVAGFTAPFWERFGRRRVMLISIVASSISLFLMAIIYHQKTTYVLIFLQTVTSVIVMLSILINFIESLPFTMRTWAIVGMEMLKINGPILSILLISYPHISPVYYHVLFGLINIAAYYVVMRYTRESLCHLVVTGRIEEADARVLNEELKLTRDLTGVTIDHLSECSSVSDKYAREMGTAQLITDSLAYNENEGYSIAEFLRRLPKSHVVYRLVYCCFAANACGLVGSFLFAQLPNMQFRSSFHMFLMMVTNIISMCSLAIVRKWSRVRAMVTLMGLIILTLCARAALIRNHPGRCSHRVVWDEVLYSSAMLVVIASALNDIFYQSLLLHSGENAPSRLRIPIMTLSVLIKEFTKYCAHFYTIDSVRKEIICILVLGAYLCGLMIVGIVFRRVLDRDNFAIFVKDLVPRKKHEGFKEVDCDEMTEAEAAMKIPDVI